MLDVAEVPEVVEVLALVMRVVVDDEPVTGLASLLEAGEEVAGGAALVLLDPTGAAPVEVADAEVTGTGTVLGTVVVLVEASEADELAGTVGGEYELSVLRPAVVEE